MPQPDYQRIYTDLANALKEGYHEQLALLRTTDATFAFIEEFEPQLSDDELLGLKVLLGQAEAILTRYFGM